MPALDKTGPQGKGPLTGRGLGLCGSGLGIGRRFPPKKQITNKKNNRLK